MRYVLNADKLAPIFTGLTFTSDSLQYRGVYLTETSGAPASVRLHSGQFATGIIVDQFLLNANEIGLFEAEGVVPLAAGLFVEVLFGTVKGVIFT